MDWSRYKVLCDEPQFWSRWMLEQSAGLFVAMGEPDLGAVLDSANLEGPLAKPADHSGPPATDMFRLDLPHDVRLRALALVEQAVREGRTAGGRGLGGFVEAWREYANAAAKAGDAGDGG